MARIRTIKPEFWTSEQVTECSPNARLLFIGLLNFCDDSGVHPESVKRLKMEVFPSDDFTTLHVAGMVEELLSAGLLELYAVADKGYWRVTGWRQHQRIDQPTFKHPLPGGRIPVNVRRKDAEDSPNVRGTFTDRSMNVHPGKGKEGKGEEGTGIESGIGAGAPQSDVQMLNGKKASAGATGKSSGTRIPADWALSEGNRQYAKSNDVDPNHEAEKFRDYWLSKPGATGMKADWDATWRNWVRNAAEYSRDKSPRSNVAATLPNPLPRLTA